jgi:hypothetical protein
MLEINFESKTTQSLPAAAERPHTVSFDGMEGCSVTAAHPAGARHVLVPDGRKRELGTFSFPVLDA